MQSDREIKLSHTILTAQQLAWYYAVSAYTLTFTALFAWKLLQARN